MENELVATVLNIALSMKYQIVMFLLSGLALEFAIEFVKGTLFPKGKNVPRWVGMMLGAIATIVYLATAYASAKDGAEGWFIPGGVHFVYVWFILFYLYQYKSIKVSKAIFNRLFPSVKDPDWVKPVKEKKLKGSDLTEEELKALLAKMGK